MTLTKPQRAILAEMAFSGNPLAYAGGPWVVGDRFHDLTPAQEVRDSRKDPALWEIMTTQEADCKDAREQLNAARRPRPGVMALALASFAAKLRER